MTAWDRQRLADVATAELTHWVAPDEAQDRRRRDYLDHLAAHPDGMWRSCRVGHLTSSAIIVDPLRERVLLTLHPTVGRWLQTGGHCEPGDASLAEAALREAREESGLADLVLQGPPLRLDRHAVACRGEDGVRSVLDHLDVQWCVITASVDPPVRSAESTDLRWWPWDGLPQGPHGADGSVRSLIDAARDRLRWSP